MAADNRRKFKTRGVYALDPATITKAKPELIKLKKPGAVKASTAKPRSR